MSLLWSAQFRSSSADVASISPDGRYIILIDSHELFLYNLENGDTNEVEIPSSSTDIVWISTIAFCVGCFNFILKLFTFLKFI